MQNAIYTLPELNFVGGVTKSLRYNLKDTNGEPFDASGCTVNFAVCSYADKKSTPLFSVTPSILADEGGVPDVLLVQLTPELTRSLYGVYVYQITIIDIFGKIGIPNQGIMNITRNIDQNFIQ